MTTDRDALVAAYRAYRNVSPAEAERAVRSVELTYAERQNAELLAAIDAADGEHLRQTEELRHGNDVLQRMLEVMPDKHMRFGVMNKDGTVEEPDKCADWCYACKLDKLRAEVDEWKSWESQARGACMALATRQGYTGTILAHIQAGHYSKALAAITAADEKV